MTKRAKLSKGTTSAVLRVSRAGVDVDTATSDQLLLDERVFYGQLYMAGYVANPDPGTLNDVNIAIPTLGYTPVCMVVYKYTSGTSYPSFYYYVSSGTMTIFDNGWVVTPTQLKVKFGTGVAVLGAYYLVFRVNR